MKWTVQQDAIALDGLHEKHGADAEALPDKLHRMGPQKRTQRVRRVEQIWQRTGQDPKVGRGGITGP